MKAWFRIDLWKRVMIGLAIGLAIGTAVRYGMISSLGHDDGIARSREIAEIFKPLGDLFLNLIRMLDRDGEPFVDPDDDVLVGMHVTAGGKVVHPMVRAALDERGAGS